MLEGNIRIYKSAEILACKTDGTYSQNMKSTRSRCNLLSYFKQQVQSSIQNGQGLGGAAGMARITSYLAIRRAD